MRDANERRETPNVRLQARGARCDDRRKQPPHEPPPPAAHESVPHVHSESGFLCFDEDCAHNVDYIAARHSGPITNLTYRVSNTTWEAVCNAYVDHEVRGYVAFVEYPEAPPPCDLLRLAAQAVLMGVQGLVLISRDPLIHHAWLYPVSVGPSAVPIPVVSVSRGVDLSRRNYVRFHDHPHTRHVWASVRAVSDAARWPSTPRGRARLLGRVTRVGMASPSPPSRTKPRR